MIFIAHLVLWSHPLASPGYSLWEAGAYAPWALKRKTGDRQESEGWLLLSRSIRSGLDGSRLLCLAFALGLDFAGHRPAWLAIALGQSLQILLAIYVVWHWGLHEPPNAIAMRELL